MSLLRALVVVAALAALGAPAVAYNNGMGRTPQLGWNSWNHFHCNLNQTVVQQTIDAMVSTGLKDAGYEYVNMDDCWAGSRLPNGTIVPDPKSFPDGVKPLADHAHSVGLKFGLYSDAGTHTCAGRPGSLGYEKNDADTYASWGVDYLKYDNCNNNNILPTNRYPVMQKALNETGRHIFFSLCEWGQENPWFWAGAVGNSWRTTGDISDNWDSMVVRAAFNEGIWKFGAHYGWNDPDMLEVGNGGMTTNEYICHFSLWAMLKAPMLIGCDITKMTSDTKMILMNSEVLALNQDALGISAHRVWSSADGVEWYERVMKTEDASLLLALGATNARVDTCNKAGYQQWKLSGTQIINNDGRCLDIDECYSNVTSWGNNVSIYPCGLETTDLPDSSCDAHNQEWTHNSDGTITSGLDSQCLSVYPEDMPNYSERGWNVVTLPCASPVPDWQKWTVNSDGTIVSAYEQQCLSVWQDVPMGNQEVWAGPLSNGDIVVALFNQGVTTADITAQWSDIGLDTNTHAKLRDLWQHKDLGSFVGNYTVSVDAHSIVVLRATPNH